MTRLIQDAAAKIIAAMRAEVIPCWTEYLRQTQR